MNVINKEANSLFSPKSEKLCARKQDINNQTQNLTDTNNILKLEKNSLHNNTKITIYKKIPQSFHSPNKKGQNIININDYEIYNFNSNYCTNYCKNNKKIFTTNSSSKHENKRDNYYYSILTKTKNDSKKKNLSKINIPVNLTKNTNKFKSTFNSKEAKNKVNKSNTNNNLCTSGNKKKYNENKLSYGKTKTLNKITNNKPKVSNNLIKYSSNKNTFRISSSEDSENSYHYQISKKTEKNKKLKSNITNNDSKKFYKQNLGLIRNSNSKDSKLSHNDNLLTKLNTKDITNNDPYTENVVFNYTSINNYDIINIIKKKERMKILSRSFFGDSKQNLSNEIQIINNLPKEKIKHFINEIKTEDNKEKNNSGKNNKWKKYCVPIVSASLFSSRDDKNNKDDKDDTNEINNNIKVSKTNRKRNNSAIKFGEINKKKREILFNSNNNIDLNNMTASSFRSHSNRANSYKEKRDQHLNDRINSINDNNSIYSLIENDLYLQEQKLNEIQKNFAHFNISSDNVVEYKIDDEKKDKKEIGDFNKKKNFHLKISPTKVIVERKNKKDAKEMSYIVIKRGELLDKMRILKHSKDKL